EVENVPGRTEFRVSLPVQGQEEARRQKSETVRE
ncbi:MAG: hypothetical protein H6Q30_891, partial [Bacteroidetes bacterium]|nr:hypothetical protein [Bacteroidota bacterium]